MANTQSQSIYQQGYNEIDSKIGQGDPQMGVMVSIYIDKMAGPMAKRMGISPQALKQLTMQLIEGRARQKMREEQVGRQSKMKAADTIGRAERAEETHMAGLKLERDAFMRKLTTQYVGAAMSAAGSFIAQGLESGLFKSEPEMTTQQKLAEYDDLDAMDLDIDKGPMQPNMQRADSYDDLDSMDMGIDAGTANQQINMNVYDDFDELDSGALQPSKAPDTRPAYMRPDKNVDTIRPDSRPDTGPFRHHRDKLQKMNPLENLRPKETFSPKDDEEELAAALSALRGFA